VRKIGKAPKTFYELVQNIAEPIVPYTILEKSKEDFLKQHYLLITETGRRLEGIKAMQFWCERQKLPFEKRRMNILLPAKNI